MENKEKNLHPVGQRIKDRLEEINKDQTWLAREVGYSDQAAISLICRRGTGKKMHEIAMTLELNYEWLMRGTGHKIAPPPRENLPHIETNDIQATIYSLKKTIEKLPQDEQLSLFQWLENRLGKKRNSPYGGVSVGEGKSHSSPHRRHKGHG